VATPPQGQVEAHVAEARAPRERDRAAEASAGSAHGDAEPLAYGTALDPAGDRIAAVVDHEFCVASGVQGGRERDQRPRASHGPVGRAERHAQAHRAVTSQRVLRQIAPAQQRDPALAEHRRRPDERAANPVQPVGQAAAVQRAQQAVWVALVLVNEQPPRQQARVVGAERD
jgi:hypothetical protein